MKFQIEEKPKAQPKCPTSMVTGLAYRVCEVGASARKSNLVGSEIKCEVEVGDIVIRYDSPFNYNNIWLNVSKGCSITIKDQNRPTEFTCLRAYEIQRITLVSDTEDRPE